MIPKRDKIFYERQNKVVEKLALIHLSPNESKYCLVVLRKTFLFGKYEDTIRREQMAMLTGMAGTTVSDVKKRLKERGIIHSELSVIRFNLNIDQWEKVKVSLPFKKVKVSLPKGQGRAEEKGQGIITLQRNYKLNSSKKVLSKAKERGKERKVPKGLKQFQEDLKNMPGLKK